MDKKEHTLRAYDEALKRYKKQILQLFTGCATALELTCQALREWNLDLARQVISEDKILDTLHDAVNNRCITILAGFAPVSVDLQFVLSLMRLAGILERIGDHTAKIAKYALKLDAHGYNQPIEPVTNALDHIARQFRRTSSAFESGDREMVGQYLGIHREKGHKIERLTEALSSLADTRQLPVPVLAELVLISRTLEHIWNGMLDAEEEIAALPF